MIPTAKNISEKASIDSGIDVLDISFNCFIIPEFSPILKKEITPKTKNIKINRIPKKRNILHKKLVLKSS